MRRWTHRTIVASDKNHWKTETLAKSRREFESDEASCRKISFGEMGRQAAEANASAKHLLLSAEIAQPPGLTAIDGMVS